MTVMSVLAASKSCTATARILDVRHLTPQAVVLRFERSFDFEPGQYLRVGLPGDENSREYSIYSSPDDTAFEILLKEIPDGPVSPRLHECKPGDALSVSGPFGHFRLPSESHQSQRFVFVATGTGIAPFHSMALAHPELDYLLLHGVSFNRELYEASHFPSTRHCSCVTREPGGYFSGRVTDYLRLYPAGPDQLFYFCGNSEMIFEGFQILSDRGVTSDRMFAEIYY